MINELEVFFKQSYGEHRLQGRTLFLNNPALPLLKLVILQIGGPFVAGKH